MSALKNLANIDTTNWEQRNNLLNYTNTLTGVEIEAEIAPFVKNKRFVHSLLNLINYAYHARNFADISEPLVSKIYSTIKGDVARYSQLVYLKNITTDKLEEIIEATAEHMSKPEHNSYWGMSSRIVNNPNFTKALEDKLCASPKKYSFMYEALYEISKDEKNLVTMAKYLKDSWSMRKLVKKRCLTHASLEKIAKFAPEAVVMHSLRLTPDFVDTLAKSKDKDVVAAAVTNKNIREETLREILLNADPDKDYSIIRNVAWNKKASVENLALAFSKMPSGFYNLKEFVKRSDLMEFIQKKLAESKL